MNLLPSAWRRPSRASSTYRFVRSCLNNSMIYSSVTQPHARLVVPWRYMTSESRDYINFILPASSSCNQLRPRCIGCLPQLACFFPASVLFHSNLHWTWWPYPVTKEDQSGRTITVFAKMFPLMHIPVVQTSKADLYEVDGMLEIYSRNCLISHDNRLLSG
jgi:hypothetical protein